MWQVINMCSAVCSFAPCSQAAIEAIPHLCISEQNRPTLVCRQLNLTHAGLGKKSWWPWADILSRYMELESIFLPLHAPFILHSLCHTDADCMLKAQQRC